MLLTTGWEGHSDVLTWVESVLDKDSFLYLWISVSHSLWRCYSSRWAPFRMKERTTLKAYGINNLIHNSWAAFVLLSGTAARILWNQISNARITLTPWQYHQIGIPLTSTDLVSRCHLVLWLLRLLLASQRSGKLFLEMWSDAKMTITFHFPRMPVLQRILPLLYYAF
jgi:hypothetical protein